MTVRAWCECGECGGFREYEDGVKYAEAHDAGSRARHPSVGRSDPREIVRVATFPDGSQILVEQFPGMTPTAATRRDRWATWGPPVALEIAP